LILHGANNLPPVLEGLGVFDAELEGELGDRHEFEDCESAGCILKPAIDAAKHRDAASVHGLDVRAGGQSAQQCKSDYGFASLAGPSD
jgi:hypothetical protein